MAEENTEVTNNPSPKEAVKNLFKSIQGPLLYFGAGIIATIIWQNRSMRKNLGR